MKKSWLQFRLSFLIILMTVAAISVAAYTQYPNPMVTVEVSANGAVVIDGQPIDEAQLKSAFQREYKQRAWWVMDCKVTLQTPSETPTEVIQHIIEAAQNNDIEEFSLRVIE